MIRSASIAMLAALLLAAAPAHAFRLGNIDLNKVGGVLESAGKLGPASEEEEREMGRGVAARLLGAAPLVADEEVQRYVNRVGRWVASHSERAGLSWHFGVLEDNTVNAFAAPGGYVFVTKGLFLRLNSEAELAGVLAHEVVHVLDKHHLDAARKQAGLEVVGGVASLAAEGRDHADKLDVAVSAGTELYLRGLDKDDEFSTDRKGVVLAARAGYDPYALLAVLQALAAIDPKDSGLALMFKTHPAPGDRIERLAPVLDGHLGKLGPLPQVDGRFQQIQARLLRP